MTVLTLRRDFAATPERVFDAWLDPDQARLFLFATPGGTMQTCTIDARVGGEARIIERRASVDAEHRLRFEVIDRPHRLVFLFAGEGGDDPEWSRVAIDIAASDTGCTLTLTHQIDPAWAAYEDQTRKGWTMILESLGRITERDDD
jgi:uncharacterized protein YndB with AHSA1/START domain